MIIVKLVVAAIAVNLNILAGIGLHVLPDCPTEDSHNCAWHGDRQGNQLGPDFVDFAGVTLYPTRKEWND